MTTPQPRLISQRYEGAVSSTSPTVEQPAPVTQPSALIRIGTSALAQGALLFALLVPDPASAQRNVLYATAQRGSDVRAAPVATTACSSEMVDTIILKFGLNRSQAADVMRVRRQSIYNWLRGAEAEGANLVRMLCLYSVAKSIANPIEPHLVVRSTPDGTNSLLRMLSSDRLDRSAIVAWTIVLTEPNEIPWPQPLEDVLRDAGIERNAERERQRGRDSLGYLQG